MKNRLKRLLIKVIISVAVCYAFSFLIVSVINNEYKFVIELKYLFDKKTILFMFFFIMIEFLLILLYYYKHYWLLNSQNIIKGNEKDLHLTANLEQSRFQSNKELDKNFKTFDYESLKNIEITGSLIKAEEEKGKLKVTFSKPAHTLVIGTTGSGKTTTFVNPMIQILAETKTKPSMFISDPKGELYADHAEALKKKRV